MKNAILWDVVPCASSQDQRLGGTSVLARRTRRRIPEDAILHKILPQQIFTSTVILELRQVHEKIHFSCDRDEGNKLFHTLNKSVSSTRSKAFNVR
jgi:hypothetical protein